MFLALQLFDFKDLGALAQNCRLCRLLQSGLRRFRILCGLCRCSRHWYARLTTFPTQVTWRRRRSHCQLRETQSGGGSVLVWTPGWQKINNIWGEPLKRYPSNFQIGKGQSYSLNTRSTNNQQYWNTEILNTELLKYWIVKLKVGPSKPEHQIGKQSTNSQSLYCALPWLCFETVVTFGCNH